MTALTYMYIVEKDFVLYSINQLYMIFLFWVLLLYYR